MPILGVCSVKLHGRERTVCQPSLPRKNFMTHDGRTKEVREMYNNPGGRDYVEKGQLMTFGLTEDDPYSGDEVETYTTCHGLWSDFSPDKMHSIS